MHRVDLRSGQSSSVYPPHGFVGDPHFIVGVEPPAAAGSVQNIFGNVLITTQVLGESFASETTAITPRQKYMRDFTGNGENVESRTIHVKTTDEERTLAVTRDAPIVLALVVLLMANVRKRQTTEETLNSSFLLFECKDCCTFGISSERCAQGVCWIFQYGEGAVFPQGLKPLHR